MSRKASDSNKMKCIDCGEEKTIKRNFYITYSDLYSTLGRIPICKDCIAERFQLLVNRYDGDEFLALEHCCLNFDIYYDEDLAKSVSNSNGNELLITAYMKKFNQNAKCRNKTSLDFIIEKEKQSIKEEKRANSVFSDDDIKITDKIRFTWGIGFTDDEYRVLEMRYKEYEDYYDLEDLAKKQTIRELCVIRLLADRARIAGRDKEFNDYMKLVSTKQSDSGIKPNQKKNFGEGQGETFAMKMKIYETTKPVIKRLKEYEDVDGFEKYINRHMIKPLAVAEGFATGDYSLDNGSDNIELKEDFQEIVNGINSQEQKEKELDKDKKQCEQNMNQEN